MIKEHARKKKAAHEDFFRGLQVEVLEMKDKWFGVTYKGDKESEVQSFKKLIEDGVYKEDLYSDL